MSATTSRHLVIATAGHVDHGKSALVKALTGTDPDRLPEEKARGITIDLGFAHLQLPAESPGDVAFDIGVVDVPGHEDFVKNMVAGVGSISLALLVVAADDGWMAQTEEHLQILAYLGSERMVVALTKMDLAQQSEEILIAEIRDKLRDSPFANAPTVPVSVTLGKGINELKSVLRATLTNTPLPPDIGKPRLPVDRVFTLRGIGTVVTGTLLGGTLRKGGAVVVQPGGSKARIRSLQTHNHEIESAGPGTRVALNLPDLAVADDKAANANAVSRGDIITFPHSGSATKFLEVLLSRTSRPAADGLAMRALKHGCRVQLHIGSTAVPTRVVLADGAELLPGAQGFAQLRLEAPLWIFCGDRFVLRDVSGRVTLAGGVMLEPDSHPKKFRTAAQQNFLKTIARSPGNVDAVLEAHLVRDRILARSGLLMKSHFSESAVADALARFNREGKAILSPELVIEQSEWQSLCWRAAEAIDIHHKKNPEQEGLTLAELKSAFARILFSEKICELVVGELAKQEFVRNGMVIRRQSHQPALPPQLRAAGAAIKNTLALKPLDPPSRKELAPDALRQQALRFLLQTGQAVELNADLVLAANAFERARESVRQFLARRSSATVSELRQALGASRRIVVPLLEKLDREAVTQRIGDRRSLKVKPGNSAAA